MKRLTVLLFAASLLSLPAWCGRTPIGQVHVAAGAVLTFQLQTRLKASTTDAMDEFPPGTRMRVKVLDPIDSMREADGTPFQGTLMAPLVSGGHVVAHSDAGVSGMLVLLRSREHPQGFRYELLITEISDGAKRYPVTASLSRSLYDPSETSETNATKNQR
ncbi:MAG: hypothetical protein ACYDDI_06535 [Candidatus Acidiferrales bacterium]